MKLRSMVLFVSLMVGISVGCTNKGEKTSFSAKVPSIQGPVVDPSSIPSGSGQKVVLSNGAEVFVSNRGGGLYYSVEGTLSPDAFFKLQSQVRNKPVAERKAFLERELLKIFEQIRSVHGVGFNHVAEVGYFTFEMPYRPELMDPLKGLHFDHEIFVNPVSAESSDLRKTEKVDLDPRSKMTDFSGLDRLHSNDFVKKAEADIGEGTTINGSSVKVGVTDTGITYHHPTFLSQDGKSVRIDYMRDFSKEGRVYFNPQAKFEVSVPEDGSEEDLVVNAQVILTPKLPNIPMVNEFENMEGLKIKVSPELREILIKSKDSGIKLGVLNEEAFQSDSESVDINGDGSLDSKIFLLYVPGKTPDLDAVYVDVSGTADFRASEPIQDWNKSRMMVEMFAEQVGFDFKDEEMPTSKGDKLQVKSVSVIGIDPGSHGTHVSGIIAGRKTIQNDSSSTLARGLAPEAHLAMNRVCANNGGCNATAAIIDLAMNARVNIINMSLGGLSVFNDGYGVQETIINRISSMSNVLFVISAGNSGPGRQTVGSPSTARSALSVGATANSNMIQRQYQWQGTEPSYSNVDNNEKVESDFMLFFSSRGPTAAGGFKPNVTAPGTELSSVHLNSAQGEVGGMDVFWGTSMAAPAATGSVALLLDAINKYNLNHLTQPLTTDMALIRNIIIQSARPFDVSRWDPASGDFSQGKYTWIDEGLGMIDLRAAWKMLFEVRDNSAPSAVQWKGESIPLEYEVILPMKSPSGAAYDGSRAASPKTPAFGNGLYLDFFDTDTIRQVSVIRKLPEAYALFPELGQLMWQLRTTKDDFVLKTVFYGSNKPWLRVGTLDQVNCKDSVTSSAFSIFSEGASVQVKKDGTGTLKPSNMSALNICLDRQIISDELPPGDHGALILAYHTVEGKTDPLASFIIPVYLTVPHHTLSQNMGYEVEQEVRSFEVRRNYVMVPKGTTLVRVKLEVPTLSKETKNCSGVELMPLIGSNVTSPFKTRAEARIMNCTATGAKVTDETKRVLSFSITKPKPGIWDLPVFGSYKYPLSKYKLRVDYLLADLSSKEIKGDLAALNGSLKLAVKEGSFQLTPDASKSSYELLGLAMETPLSVKDSDKVFVPYGDGIVRTYPVDVKKVKYATSGSPGNDIDLSVFECSLEAKDPSHPSCSLIGSGTGPTDEESVGFEPKLGRGYIARVDGATVKDEGKFTFKEVQYGEPEKGEIRVQTLDAVTYGVEYGIPEAQLQTSRLIQNELFKSGKFKIVGVLKLISQDKLSLGVIPVTIEQNSEKGHKE